jgi:vacuolar-type H+-ATPase subunit F/Vma7
MTPVTQLTIAIIGDEDLVNAMRLSGVSRYNVVKADENIYEETRQAFTTLLNDPAIGIIVLQEDYVDHVQDLITKFKESKKMTPIIIDVPSKFGTKHRDVTQYYKTYIKGYIGFDIEI